MLGKQLSSAHIASEFYGCNKADVRNSVSDEGFVYIKTHDTSRNRLYIPCRILVMTIHFDVIFGHQHYYSGAIHRLREETLLTRSCLDREYRWSCCRV